MSYDCDREGTFRARIAQCGVAEESSGAVAIIVDCFLTEFWDTETEQWVPWEEYDMYAEGKLYVVKKDGTENKTQIEPLIEFAGWNGSLADVAGNRIPWRPIQVSIKADVYNNVTRHRVNFIGDFNRVPGGLGAIDESQARQLDAIFGAKFRAIAGSQQHGRTQPAGRPAAPARPAVRPITPPAQAATQAAPAAQRTPPRAAAPNRRGMTGPGAAYPDPNAVGPEVEPPFNPQEGDPEQYDEQGNRIPY